MTRRDSLVCAHEPFGDSFYYGPERLGERYEQDARCDSEDRLREVRDSLRVDYAEEDGLQGGDQDGLKELRE